MCMGHLVMQQLFPNDMLTSMDVSSWQKYIFVSNRRNPSYYVVCGSKPEAKSINKNMCVRMPGVCNRLNDDGFWLYQCIYFRMRKIAVFMISMLKLFLIEKGVGLFKDLKRKLIWKNRFGMRHWAILISKIIWLKLSNTPLLYEISVR